MCITLALVSKVCQVIDGSKNEDLLKALNSKNHLDLMTVENSENFILISNPYSKCKTPEQDLQNYVEMISQIHLVKLPKSSGQGSIRWNVEKDKAVATLEYKWGYQKGYQVNVAFDGGMVATAGKTTLCLGCVNDYLEIAIAIGEEAVGTKAAIEPFKKVSKVVWKGTKEVATGAGWVALGALVMVAMPLILVGGIVQAITNVELPKPKIDENKLFWFRI